MTSLQAMTAQLVQRLQQQGGMTRQQLQQLQKLQLQRLQQQQQQLQQQQQQVGGITKQFQQQQFQQQQFQQQQQQQQQQFQQQQQQQQQAGNVKVYTGPKDGKFIINKHGKKVYIDRKSLNNNLQYQKAKPKKAAKARKA